MAEQYSATCKHVEDGDTFVTANDNWIRLARVDTPELGTTQGSLAKKILQELIEGKEIVYEQVGVSYDRKVAEVWINNKSVNDYMRTQGYPA